METGHRLAQKWMVRERKWSAVERNIQQGERKQIGVKGNRYPKRGKLWAPGRIHAGKEKRHNGGVQDGRGGGENRERGGRWRRQDWEKERGVKFPSGFQLGRINSVLELTLTPSLPLFPAQHTGQATLSHSGGRRRGEIALWTPFLKPKWQKMVQ